MRSEKKQSFFRRYGIALLFIVLGTLLGAWRNRATDQGKQDIVTSAVRETIGPPANALGRVSRWFSEQTGWLFHGHQIAMENQRLRERVAELEQKEAVYNEATIKIGQMRDDLRFVGKQVVKPIGANVIGRRTDAKFDTATIAAGSRQGVHPHSIVITRSGVVGSVLDVTPDTASVVLLTDENSRPGVRIQRAGSRVIGNCLGNYSPYLTLLVERMDADVKVNDVVITAGSAFFPPGLIVGTVMDVKIDGSNGSKTARVKPAVDFDRLEQVYVLP